MDNEPNTDAPSDYMLEIVDALRDEIGDEVVLIVVEGENERQQ